jgi:signal transduction histidine kinase/ActR/RegA family two-component response regulator
VKSYNFRLVALLVAAVLPVMAIASVLVVYVARQESSSVETETRANVARVVDLVDREIGANLRVLEALATSANLDQPNLRSFHEEARRVLKSQPSWLTLILLDLDGWQILSARQPFDRSPIKVIEPHSYEEAVRTGRAVVGGISEPSPRTGIRAIPLRVPVVRDGRTRYILTAPLRPNSIGALLRGGGVPAAWIGGVVDRAGRIVARSRDAEIYIGRSANEHALTAVRSAAGSGLYDGRTFEGSDVIAAFGTSPLTGWTVHFGIPRESIQGPYTRAVLGASLGGLVSIVLAATLVWLVQRDAAAQRRQEATLRQAQKMEAIGRMTGGLAHDFNNMLAVIRSAAGLLRRRPNDPRQEVFLDGIVDATDRAANLTRQLLSFAGRRAWQSQAIDLASRVSTTADLLRSCLRSDIDLRLDLADGLWPVELDPAELEFALLNLAANARDAMPKGGSLRLAARNISLPQSGEDVLDLHGDYVRFVVSDTGTGMAPDVVERAFEPFFTTKEHGKGTGLGLSQVYGFARQAGGAATIQSRQGAGTTVTLYLPRSRKIPAEFDLVDGAEFLPGRRSRILVVEDDPAVSSMTVAVLEHLGHTAVAVGRATEALEVLLRGQQFDLVFSDVVMPGDMDGIQLAQEIRRSYPTMPVLLVTGYSVKLASGTASPCGVDILRKPYSVSALQHAIAESLTAQAVS